MWVFTYLNIFIGEKAHVLEVCIKICVVPPVSTSYYPKVVGRSPKKLLNWYTSTINVLISGSFNFSEMSFLGGDSVEIRSVCLWPNIHTI
jgi:hypothetical protein